VAASQSFNRRDPRFRRYGSSSSFAAASGTLFGVTAAFAGGNFAVGVLTGVPEACAVPAFLTGAAFPTVKYFFILARRFSPIPRTARKSSTLLNAPYDLRICKILSAVDGPIPGTCCNSAALAVFKLTG